MTLKISVALVVVVGLLASGVLIDRIPLSSARPPENLKTLEEFQDWKRGAIIGYGTFENSGAAYTVMLAPAGRHLASGPSAYLFDENGQFIDWTFDMGDFSTVNYRFDLTGGALKNTTIEKH